MPSLFLLSAICTDVLITRRSLVQIRPLHPKKCLGLLSKTFFVVLKPSLCTHNVLRVFEPDEGRITCIRADRYLVGTSSAIRDIYSKIAHGTTVPPLRKKARSVRLRACKRTRNAFRRYHLFAINAL